MKRSLPLIGTVLFAAGIVFAAESAIPGKVPVVTTSVKIVTSGEEEGLPAAGAAKGDVGHQKTPTGRQILAGLKTMSSKDRAEAKGKAEQGKQQFAMVKALVALQGKMDPDQTEQLAMAEGAIDNMIELFTLLDKADAAVAAGDTKKAEEANTAAEEKAGEFAKLQERMQNMAPTKVGSKATHKKKLAKVSTPAPESATPAKE